MKKTLNSAINISAILGLLTLSMIVSSCSDEVMYSVAEDVTTLSREQVEKQMFGCTNFTETKEKIETAATSEYIEYLKSSYYNLLAHNKVASTEQAMVDLKDCVGVIKDKTCKSYRELRVYYDSQDGRNANKMGGGYIPNGLLASIKEGTQFETSDLSITFCVVPASSFYSIGKKYAVLKFGFDVTPNLEEHGKGCWETRIFMRHMDAEDSNNKSYMYLENVPDYNNSPYTWLSMEETIKKTGLTTMDNKKNLDLAFVCYRDDTPVKSTILPDLGFPYAVFGKLWNNIRYEGWYYSDDEDNNNGNWAGYRDFYFASNTNSIILDPKTNESGFGNLPNLADSESNPRDISTTLDNQGRIVYCFMDFIECSVNTKFFFSKNTNTD